MARVLTMRPVMSGVRQVLKSQGVAALINQQGERAAARCNSLAHLEHAKQQPRYSATPKTMSYVSASLVHADNAEAYVDNLRHNTLKKGCGV